ncbi:hypothetical protein VNO80_14902 [Phaseolus coccineus]|uniref:Uncharacterized protein n=1 Tax=Phaseolus coccineus TaxID=3886 RepID=A0AAN9MP95_PHACN
MVRRLVQQARFTVIAGFSLTYGTCFEVLAPVRRFITFLLLPFSLFPFHTHRLTNIVFFFFLSLVKRNKRERKEEKSRVEFNGMDDRMEKTTILAIAASSSFSFFDAYSQRYSLKISFNFLFGCL